MRFQAITALALNKNYVGSDWFDQNPSLRFPTAVITRSELFMATMEQYGQLFRFEEYQPEAVLPAVPASKSVRTAKPVSEFTFNLSAASSPDDQVELRQATNHLELDEIVLEEVSISKTVNQDTINWLTKTYNESRGFELGTFDSSLLAMTMKTQSSKWENIALAYISDVISLAHTFIKDLLHLICPDSRVREELMSKLMPNLRPRYAAGLQSARFLLHVERMGTPLTLNHYFNDNLEKRSVRSSSQFSAS